MGATILYDHVNFVFRWLAWPPIKYRMPFEERCQAIYAFGIEKHEERKREIESFLRCARDAIMASRAISHARVDEFLAAKPEVSEWQTFGWPVYCLNNNNVFFLN